MSIRLKVAAIIVVFVVAAGTLGALAVDAIGREITETLMRDSLARAGEAFDTLEAADIAKLGAAVDVALTRDDLRQAFMERDQQRLYRLAAPIFDDLRANYGITHWYFETAPPESEVFLRVHNLPLYGDVIERETYRQAVESGDVGFGKELGQTAFALRVVRPMRDESGAIVGYMEMGEEIDHFLEEMRAETGDEYGIVVEKSYLDRDMWASVAEVQGRDDRWDDHPNNLVVDSTSDDILVNQYAGDVDAIPEAGIVLESVQRGDSTLVHGVVPLKDASGEEVGGILVLKDVTGVVSRLDDLRSASWGISLLVGVAAVGILLITLNRLVFARLERVMTRLEDISTRLLGGDFEVEGNITPGSRDEIGDFEEYFGRFIGVCADALRRTLRGGG